MYNYTTLVVLCSNVYAKFEKYTSPTVSDMRVHGGQCTSDSIYRVIP